MKTWTTALLCSFLSLLLLASCQTKGSPGKAQIEKVEKTAMEARADLFELPNARLVAEKSRTGTDPRLHPGCVYVAYYMIFESEEPFDKIIASYRENLKVTGWEPHPGIKQGDRFYVFRKSPQIVVDISDYSLRDDILPVPTLAKVETKKTIYYVLLAYYDPSEERCMG